MIFAKSEQKYYTTIKFYLLCLVISNFEPILRYDVATGKFPDPKICLIAVKTCPVKISKCPVKAFSQYSNWYPNWCPIGYQIVY